MDLKEIGWESEPNSSGQEQEPVTDSCEHNNEPFGSHKRQGIS